MPQRAKPTSCHGCPFLNVGKGYVPPTFPGPNQPTLGALVGQGPGAQEVAQGVPFFAKAPAGGFLDQMLSRAGLDRRGFVLDNIIRCRIGKDETPEAAVRECTQRHLLPTLRTLAGKYGTKHPMPVLAIGIPAAKVLQGGWAGQGTAGTLVEVTL